MADLAYGTGPRGLPGNDDLGTMSAWYVFSAMGIYPQDPARAEMLLSSPVFERVVIHRGNGVDITIESPGAGADNIYVQSVTLNGAPHTRSWLPESVMNRGGTVRIDVGAEPNRSWGTAEADLPIYQTD